MNIFWLLRGGGPFFGKWQVVVNVFWLAVGGGRWWWTYFCWWWVVVVDKFLLVVGGGGHVLADGGWWWMVVGGGIVQSNPGGIRGIFLLRSLLLLFIKEHYFAKNILKSSAFLKNLSEICFHETMVELEVFFYRIKYGLIETNMSQNFSEHQSVCLQLLSKNFVSIYLSRGIIVHGEGQVYSVIDYQI